MCIGLTHTPKKLVTGAGGFTLVELLIVVAISAVVMAGAVQLFIGARDSHELVKNLKVLEENGRIGMEIVAREVRAATTLQGGVPLHVWDNDILKNTYIDGFAGAVTRTGLGALDGTDILEVFVTKCSEPLVLDTFNQVSASLGKQNENIITSCLPCYNSGDTDAILGACLEQYSIRIQQLTTVGDPSNGVATGYSCQYSLTDGNTQGGNGINLNMNRGTSGDSSNRPHDCDATDGRGKWDATATIGNDVYYYVRANDPYNADVNNPIPQLMRYQVSTAGLAAEPIAYNVEDFQVLVGEDNTMDNTVTPPVPAPNGVIDSWQNGIVDGPDVFAIKVSMLIKSPKDEKNAKAALAVPQIENSDISKTPDRRRRRVITRTIRIRNMN